MNVTLTGRQMGRAQLHNGGLTRLQQCHNQITCTPPYDYRANCYVLQLLVLEGLAMDGYLALGIHFHLVAS